MKTIVWSCLFICLVGIFVILDNSSDIYVKKIGFYIFVAGLYTIFAFAMIDIYLLSEDDTDVPYKSKIIKHFILEQGKITPELFKDTKELRTALLNEADCEYEQIALMGDEEIRSIANKKFFFFSTKEGQYMIKRTKLANIAGDITFVANNDNSIM